MQLLKKRILDELDDLITRAPDIDMENEYQHFRQLHLEALTDQDLHIEGLSGRLLLITDILRFQHLFLKNCDISQALSDILILAKALNREDVIKNFYNKSRMQQMFYILEKKGITEACDHQKKMS